MWPLSSPAGQLLTRRGPEDPGAASNVEKRMLADRRLPQPGASHQTQRSSCLDEVSRDFSCQGRRFPGASVHGTLKLSACGRTRSSRVEAQLLARDGVILEDAKDVIYHCASRSADVRNDQAALYQLRRR